MTIAQRESLSLRLAAPSPLNHVVTREEEVVVKYLRKGRFDEIFFADLPHATDGFTGAEIDQIVNSAIYAACVAGDGLGAEWLMQEAASFKWELLSM